MGKTYDVIDERLAGFIERQHMFFVGTAPSGDDGHVNISPKGYDTFALLGPSTVAYLDLTGSGIETVSHLRDNGRIVIMFCAFEGPPKIVRLHGRGQVLETGEPEFDELVDRFPSHVGARGIVRVEVTRVSDSCGYSVPLLRYEAERDVLEKWTRKRGEDGVRSYRAEANRHSIDGLPGLERAVR